MLETKRKSKFPIVLLVLVIIIGITFTFAVNKMKDKYRVLDTNSNEVSSMLPDIKDYRKLKGYKVIKDSDDYKIVLISAGLTYGKDDSLTVKDVLFNGDKVKITVEESIDPSPEKEVVRYPYVVLKLDTSKNHIEVSNTKGEEYIEIDLHDETAGIPEVQVKDENAIQEQEDISKDEVSKEDEAVVEEQGQVSDEKDEAVVEEQEQEQVSDEAKNMKYVTGEYQGRIDGGSIEVKVGSEYVTFDISGMAMSFPNYQYGTKLKLGYLEKNGGNILISVTE